MVKQFLRKSLWLVLILPLVTFSAVPAWQVVPQNSSITFTATQNNSPVTGKFTAFSGDINFDPARLKESNITIRVDLNSVTTEYGDIATTLKTADWFNIAKFPQAIFKASDFTKTGDKTYQANGTLTIRDKTVPVVLSFILENYSDSKADAKGSAQLKRTLFNVGQGEWAKTDAVKDDVKIDFVVSALRK